MKINDLKKFNLSELDQIGCSLAVLITGDIADSSYEDIFNSLDIYVPPDKEWNYSGGDDESQFFDDSRDLLVAILGKRIAMACYCDPNSVPDYLDGNSADAWSECVLDADPDASADDICNAICDHI